MGEIDMERLASFFMKGDVRSAMEYLAEIPGTEELLAPYRGIFEKENYISYPIPFELDSILLIYQKYYRDVFYLRKGEEEAAGTLLSALAEALGTTGEEETITRALKRLFEAEGYHILTGKTNGFYGPYVWKKSETRAYDVELPSGTTTYAVKVQGEFLMRSWMDYITFGMKGTRGWTEADGTICLVENTYDEESEEFKVSVLKHEAQHAYDVSRYPFVTAPELEYRAKLVELIYSTRPGLLSSFLLCADEDRTDDSHAVASVWLKERMGELEGKDISQIQEKARELLSESNRELDAKANQSR